MIYEYEEYHKRNVLLSRIVWIQVAVYTGLYLVLQLPLYTYIDMAAEAVLVGLPVELLKRSRRMSIYVPYFFGAGWLIMLVVCNLIFSYWQHVKILNPFSFLISAVMVAQYPSVWPIVFYGALSLLTMNGFFAAGFRLTLVSHPVLFMNNFLLLLTGMLAVGSHLTTRYYRTAERLNAETRSMKAEMEGLWTKISAWGTALNGHETELVQGPSFPGDRMSLQARLQVLIEESNRQRDSVHEKNLLLEQHAKQIEQLTLQEERNRLSMELHDQIGHAYTGMTMGLESVRYLYETSPDKAKDIIEHLLDLVRQSFGEVRASIHQLAAEETEAPLSEKLRRLAEDFARGTGLRLSFETEGEEQEVSVQVRHTLYRCQQEALTNAKRHGNAETVRIHMLYAEDELMLRIADNGQGSGNLQMGFGLKTMRERLQNVQGRLQVFSRAGEGVEIVATVPLRRRYERKEIRVVIADDQPLVRESLGLLLEREADLDVVGMAEHGEQALRLCLDKRPNVALLDLNMPGMDGVEVTRRLKELAPGIRVVLMTTYGDLGQAMEAIRLGAEGYLFKSVHPKKLIDSLRLVYSGGTLISYELARQLVDRPGEDRTAEPRGEDPEVRKGRLRKELSEACGLNDRELDILEHLSQGLKYKDIAARMMFSENTIRNYISVIYSKLGVENRTQAVERLRRGSLPF